MGTRPELRVLLDLDERDERDDAVLARVPFDDAEGACFLFVTGRERLRGKVRTCRRMRVHICTIPLW